MLLALGTGCGREERTDFPDAFIDPDAMEIVDPPDMGVVDDPDEGFPPDTGDELPPDTGVPDMGPLGPPAVPSMSSALAADLRDPWAVAVSPLDGATYFSGLTGDAEPAIFRAAANGPPTVITSGDPLALPVGLSFNADGTRLWVADLAAGTQGAVLEVNLATGATSIRFGQGDLLDPAGIYYFADEDTLYLTGTSAIDGRGGVWLIGPNDMMPFAVDIGPDTELGDPTGIYVSAARNIYVYDSLGPNQLGRVWQFTADDSVVVADNLRTGFPSGVGASADETYLLVGTSTPAAGGGNVIEQVTLTDGQRTPLSLGRAFVEPRGIFNVPGTGRWVVVDGLGGANGTGGVYELR